MIYLNNAERTLYKPLAESLDPVPVETVLKLVSRLLGAESPDDVFLTRSGEQAVELALKAFVPAGGHVIAAGPEQEDTLALLRGQGAEISQLESDAYGRPKYDLLERLIRPDTKAVLCAHGCMATGNLTDLKRVCRAAREHDLPVISDGRGSAGAVEVNLGELEPDAYCFKGEGMLMGPKGVGGICACGRKNRAILQKALKTERAMPEAKVLTAFASSLQFILDKGIYGVTMLPHRLAKRFFESAKAMNSVRVWGDYGTSEHLPVVAITAENFTPEEIRVHMEERGVLIGVEKGMARFSFGYFNTRAEVKETVMQLMDLLGIDDLYLLP